MPKKTKKEKIIAELRRRLEATPQKWEMRSEKLNNEPRNRDILHKEKVFPLQSPTSHLSVPLSTHIIHDLRKTFLLAGLAISFEFIVYLIWH